jgi:hypothetical protein
LAKAEHDRRERRINEWSRSVSGSTSARVMRSITKNALGALNGRVPSSIS